VATGGTETVIEQDGKYYRVHSFTEVGSSTLNVTRPGVVEYLVVAGGGGGARNHLGGNNGGGGGGGLIHNSHLLQINSYPVNVGSGGAGFNPEISTNTQGDDSVFLGKVAVGGGTGNGGKGTDSSGGSGGGSGGTGGIETGGEALQVEGFGNNGGGSVDSAVSAGGGGGAGEPGSDGTESQGGKGGDGLYFGSTFGENLGENGWFAGGAGGTHDDSNLHGDRGIGGSGTVPENSSDSTNIDGYPNTGGGGAAVKRAGNRLNRSGNGGSGIVIVRYRIPKSEYEAEINS
jgi:hypothetical protein